MSEVQSTPVAAPAAETTTPVITDAVPAVSEPAAEAPKAEPEAATEAAPVDESAAPVEEAKAEEKSVEPITEGQLAYKGPGLVKSLIPSKKEFWLSDEAVTPQSLGLYLRGEKPDVSHAVVAWASQTGKGLLFFNKKGDIQKTTPADVLALYDATDLKKSAPHEFTFKLNGHNHTFKATSDAERDGWYLSIEKAIELGKASKEEVRESEGYKAEMEKLNKPNVGVAGAAAAVSKPKKSTEVPAAERVGSSDGEVEKKQKSRSTSRGFLNKLKNPKAEAEQKVAEKKVEKEEKKAEKEEAKAEEPEALPVAASTEAAPVLAGAATADIPAAAEEEKAAETPVTEEKSAKAAKRGSIFGRVSSHFGKLQSPAKEKDVKEAELKPEGDAAVVSENPPVLPETATTDEAPISATPAIEEPKAAETEAKKEEPVASPSKEKNNLFAGIGGFIKRGRSVSPSTQMKEPAKKEETAVAEPVAEPVKAEEPVAETDAAAAPSTETPVEKVEEPKTTETTANRRQSVLGSLGRRASKAFRGINTPKKETATPAAATEAKTEEASEVKPVEDGLLVNGESKKEEIEAPATIGDVVPDAVDVGQPQQHTPAPVVASA